MTGVFLFCEGSMRMKPRNRILSLKKCSKISKKSRMWIHGGQNVGMILPWSTMKCRTDTWAVQTCHVISKSFQHLPFMLFFISLHCLIGHTAADLILYSKELYQPSCQSVSHEDSLFREKSLSATSLLQFSRTISLLYTLRDFHGKYCQIRRSRQAGSVAWLVKSYRPEAGASAVVAGHSRLFLGETQQLLPDGLDQGGRGMGRRRCDQRRWGWQIAHRVV